MKHPDLDGRVAVVTGAAHGIGRSVAVQLAARGATVFGADLGSAITELDETIERVRRLGRPGWSVVVDVTDRSSVSALFDVVAEHALVADTIVACAGSSRRQSALASTDEDLRDTFDVITLGVFRTLQIAAHRLVAAGLPGAMLALGSVHAAIPFANALSYNVAKAALTSLCQSFAAELLAHRIAVNVLVPGLTDTPGERHFRTEEQLAAAGAALPLGRAGSAEEVAWLAANLLSPANSYMTGSVITADGGLTVALPGLGLASHPDRTLEV